MSKEVKTFIVKKYINREDVLARLMENFIKEIDNEGLNIEYLQITSETDDNKVYFIAKETE